MKTHPSETFDRRPGWLRAAEQLVRQGYRLRAVHASGEATWWHPLKWTGLAFPWSHLEELRAEMPEVITDIHDQSETAMTTKQLPARLMTSSEVAGVLGVDYRRLTRLYEHAEVADDSRYLMDAEACAYVSRLVGYRVEPAEGAESAAVTDAAETATEDSGEDESEAEATPESAPAGGDGLDWNAEVRAQAEAIRQAQDSAGLLAEVNALHGVARILARLPREARTRVVRYQIDLYELGAG